MKDTDDSPDRRTTGFILYTPKLCLQGKDLTKHLYSDHLLSVPLHLFNCKYLFAISGANPGLCSGNISCPFNKN